MKISDQKRFTFVLCQIRKNLDFVFRPANFTGERYFWIVADAMPLRTKMKSGSHSTQIPFHSDHPGHPIHPVRPFHNRLRFTFPEQKRAFTMRTLSSTIFPYM